MSFGARFGKLIKHLRGVESLSQQQLAVKAFGKESRKGLISDLERGKIPNPQQKTVDALVVAFRISTEDLNKCNAAEVGPRSDVDTLAGEFLQDPPVPFVGRAHYISKINDFVMGSESQGLLVHGMGGVGKTALISQALFITAPQLRAQCFFIDLRGFERNIAKGSILESSLVRLINRFKPNIDLRYYQLQKLIPLWKEVSRYSTDLLIFDNVADQYTLDALLPQGKVRWIATSRRILNNRADRISVEPMDKHEGELLAEQLLTGYEGGSAKQEIFERLARSCGGLPIAIKVTAATISCTPGLNLDAFFERLESARKDLSLSEHWEESVIELLRLSIAQLPSTVQTQWAKLGIFVGGFFEAAAEELLPDVDISSLMADCTRRHIVDYVPGHQTSGLRYQFHDLLRAVALRIIDALPEEERHFLRRRYSQHYAAILSGSKLDEQIVDKDVRIRTINLDIDNIRSAFEIALDENDYEAVAKIVVFATSEDLKEKFPLGAQLDLMTQAQEVLANKENMIGGDEFSIAMGRVILTRAQCMFGLADFESAEKVLLKALDDPLIIRNILVKKRLWALLGQVLGRMPNRAVDALNALAESLKEE